MPGPPNAPRPKETPSEFSILGARVMWRNFKGERKQYNDRGDRTFCIFLDDDFAQTLMADGWNVKLRKPQPDDPTEYRQPYIEVKVSWAKKAPNIVTKGNQTNKRTHITEDVVDILDSVDVETWDVKVEPSWWSNDSGSGWKAYLNKLYILVKEDDIDLKWAEEDETGQIPGF